MSDQAERQELLDAFYMQHGPCCAGCDWWRSLNSIVGDCLASPPVPSEQRWNMLGISGCTLKPEAGHLVTDRGHVCGAFKDEFDWTTLPLPYRSRIGCKTLRPLR